MTAAFQKSLAQSPPPPPIAWTNVVHATAAAKPVENSLIENVTSRLTDTSANKLIYTCLGAASALLIGTALIGASMQDSANSRPFVSKTKAEHILAAAGVVPHVHDTLPELIPAPVATTSSAVRSPMTSSSENGANSDHRWELPTMRMRSFGPSRLVVTIAYSSGAIPYSNSMAISVHR